LYPCPTRYPPPPVQPLFSSVAIRSLPSRSSLVGGARIDPVGARTTASGAVDACERVEAGVGVGVEENVSVKVWMLWNMVGRWSWRLRVNKNRKMDQRMVMSKKMCWCWCWWWCRRRWYSTST
jgi:hypothetical protein